LAALSAAVAALGTACSGSTSTTAASAPQPAASAARAVIASVSTAPSGGGSVAAPSKTRRPLAGRVVGIDPGHNGRNYADPTFINHLIWNGREREACDTTGTQTDGGYTEARFNFNVASYLSRDLRAEGAKVVLTRTTNAGVGPCVDSRAEILNRAHAGVAIDIHADGGPANGRGFTILEPVADGPNDRVLAASRRFGGELLRRYRALTGLPPSSYDGSGGIAYRDDLAGLNLTRVPKVLIECGNMRNAADASRLVRASFQRLAANAFAQAITQFLTRRR
jgi:N-acetylmuramoyl-L-alanine amidase